MADHGDHGVNDFAFKVATVNGTDITIGHMILAREQIPQQYQQLLNFIKGLQLPPDVSSLFTTVRNERVAERKALLSAHSQEDVVRKTTPNFTMSRAPLRSRMRRLTPPMHAP